MIKRERLLIKSNHQQQNVAGQQKKFHESSGVLLRKRSTNSLSSSELFFPIASFLGKIATSNPGVISTRYLERMPRIWRRNRLRTTALLATFTPITIAKRFTARWLALSLTAMFKPKALFPFEKSAFISFSWRKRCSCENIILLVTHGQTFASIGTTIFNHISSRRSRHPSTKPVCLCSLIFFWLVRSFWHK